MNLSTKMKAAVGYAAVIALFLAAVWLIVGVLDSLTRSDGAERTINNRQRATNDVVSRLYQAEVIGQALSAGQTDLFQSYVDAMMLTAQAVDSLRAIVNDRAQVARLDSVKMLLGRKVDNMDNLLDAMEADNSDELYQQYISDLIANQNREIAAPKVQHSQTVRTSEYVVHKKRKNFFRTSARCFLKGRQQSAARERDGHGASHRHARQHHQPRRHGGENAFRCAQAGRRTPHRTNRTAEAADCGTAHQRTDAEPQGERAACRDCRRELAHGRDKASASRIGATPCRP